MSRTREEYLKSKIAQEKRKAKKVGITILILAVIFLILILVMVSTGEQLIIIFLVAIPATIIGLLASYYKIRKKVTLAKDDFNKHIVEQSEKLEMEEQVKQRYDKVVSKESPEVGKVSVPEDIMVFVSYATLDADQFKIKQIADSLTATDEIKEVLYWQEHMTDNIFEYMDQNLGKCDVMLLFCSPNALKSTPVSKEWTAADSKNIPIIPIFTNAKYIPTLLSSRLGIQFDPFNLQQSINDIYNLILKKMS